ncbi:hypothetical protein GJ496_009697 [Pomphorhynchus laevis]|nr:hypothetical protein GJ496_009697 [Pomphorhynchus laevis]
MRKLLFQYVNHWYCCQGVNGHRWKIFWVIHSSVPKVSVEAIADITSVNSKNTTDIRFSERHVIIDT